MAPSPTEELRGSALNLGIRLAGVLQMAALPEGYLAGRVGLRRSIRNGPPIGRLERRQFAAEPVHIGNQGRRGSEDVRVGGAVVWEVSCGRLDGDLWLTGIGRRRTGGVAPWRFAGDAPPGEQVRREPFELPALVRWIGNAASLGRRQGIPGIGGTMRLG